MRSVDYATMPTLQHEGLMPQQKPKTTARTDAWLNILGGVERVIEGTLAEASRREQAFSQADGALSSTLPRLAQSSDRWSGLWMRSAEAEKELSNAETALATAENPLRE